LVKDSNTTPSTEPDDTTSPWRDELVTLLKPEQTEHARGFNEGIRAAIALLTRHEHDRQQRSRSAIRQRKADGKKIGGDVPYGYQIAADGETLLENPAEQRVIARARKLRSSGLSLRAVAHKLRDDRLYPRNHDPKNPRSPREFQAVQIQRMLGEIKEDDRST
jgi:DNA invertase Pin-like site-specific DNA recombinase